MLKEFCTRTAKTRAIPSLIIVAYSIFLKTIYAFLFTNCKLVVFIMIKSSNKNMGYNHYRLASFFYIIFLFLHTPICISQQNSADKQGNLFLLVNNKVDSLLGNDFLLMNARFFINKYPKSQGNPYFEATNNALGKLVLGKKEYNNIQLIYNIYDQKLSFSVEKYSKNGIILELNNQVITRFFLDDKTFVNSYELPLFPQSGFYEEIFSGKHLKVYARWSKLFINSVTLEYLGEFTSQKKMLLFEINGEKVDISSRHGFLKIFAGDSKKLNSYIKMNKIRLFKSDNNALIKLFGYTDSLL
jgi:hypothetical protein